MDTRIDHLESKFDGKIGALTHAVSRAQIWALLLHVAACDGHREDVARRLGAP